MCGSRPQHGTSWLCLGMDTPVLKPDHPQSRASPACTGSRKLCSGSGGACRVGAGSGWRASEREPFPLRGLEEGGQDPPQVLRPVSPSSAQAGSCPGVQKGVLPSGPHSALLPAGLR